jgi:hypothetical protein
LNYKIIDKDSSIKYNSFNLVKCEVARINNNYSELINLSIIDTDVTLIDNKIITFINCNIGCIYSNETVTFNVFYDYLSDVVVINIVRKYKLKKLWY